MLSMGETQSPNVSGIPTVGRIVHVTGDDAGDYEYCLAALVSGMDHKPPMIYLRVWDRDGLAEWPAIVRLDVSIDRARVHDPRTCPRLTEQPASRET